MLLVDEADGKERVLAQFALCTGEDPPTRISTAPGWTMTRM